ncbi:hypothetical protein [Tropicimonas sp. IMCC6043]|uniref:hypothetical protein n=1 Tax=Tropicimonas sp. IMCC6043 TaxID=2510645 RepID=UPI00101BC44A|nr:hypothetical protein [Tropicimonas sp. IMCC6043]RYH08881.1 hypothetical protein EU800_14185 [Tropicimonas sp. IMCC6043]
MTAILLVGLLAGSKVAQVWLFPAYRKTWRTWDRHKDPIAWKLIRAHPFHELGWYLFAALLSAAVFYLANL